jgi:hypothetical protein
MVQMKNKISGLLMEAEVNYNKQRLHKAGYFRELLATNPGIDERLCSLLRLCRETVVRLQRTASALVRSLERDALLVDRVERLMSIPRSGGPSYPRRLSISISLRWADAAILGLPNSALPSSIALAGFLVVVILQCWPSATNSPV